MSRIAIKILLIHGLCFCALPALAQQPYPANGSRPKIGLALSGGGAKGFAHIGVLKVLDEIGLPVDRISGTSIGSVIGAMYAVGYSPAAIEDIVATIDWEELFSDRVERRRLSMVEKPWDARYLASLQIRKRRLQLPAGLVAGQNIATLLAQLTWPAHHVRDFSQLAVPFSCVATDIESGQGIRISSGYLPEALRASMAIPTVFTPMLLEGKLLVDGGLARNLPAEDVRSMGADIVIGVDVGAPLRNSANLSSLLAILDQAISIKMVESTVAQRALCDYLVLPDVNEIGFSNFREAQAFIDAGEAAARELEPQLLALRDSLDSIATAKLRPRQIPGRVDSLFVYDLKLEGLERVPLRLVRAELGIVPPQWITPDQLELAIERLYSSQFFERVTYKLSPSSKGAELTMKVIERHTSLFRFGLRYDSRQETVVLLNTTFRNLTGHGSALSVDVQLAGRSSVDAVYFVHTGIYPGSGIRVNAAFAEAPLDIFAEKVREARLTSRRYFGEALIGNLFSTRLLLGVGLRGEISITDPDIAPDRYARTRAYISSLVGRMQVDSFDRSVYPRRGHSILLDGEYATAELGGDTDFRKLSFDWQGVFQLGRRVSLLSRVQAGLLSSPDLPLEKMFRLGGVDSFMGLRPQEVAGDNLQALQVGLQTEPFQNRFLTLRYNVGNVLDVWKVDLDRHLYHTGLGLTVGALTPFGPVELTYATGSRRSAITHLNVGFRF